MNKQTKVLIAVLGIGLVALLLFQFGVFEKPEPGEIDILPEMELRGQVTFSNQCSLPFCDSGYTQVGTSICDDATHICSRVCEKTTSSGGHCGTFGAEQNLHGVSEWSIIYDSYDSANEVYNIGTSFTEETDKCYIYKTDWEILYGPNIMGIPTDEGAGLSNLRLDNEIKTNFCYKNNVDGHLNGFTIKDNYFLARLSHVVGDYIQGDGNQHNFLYTMVGYKSTGCSGDYASLIRGCMKFHIKYKTAPWVEDTTTVTQNKTCSYQCNIGQTKCVGNNYYNCNNYAWSNQGVTVGHCNVNCLSDSNCPADENLGTTCSGYTPVKKTKTYSCSSYNCVSNIVSQNLPIQVGLCNVNCLSGSKCIGTDYYECSNYNWINQGQVEGECGVDCLSGSNKCVDYEYYFCSNSAWINQGKVIGECNVNCLLASDCPATTYSPLYCFNNNVVHDITSSGCGFHYTCRGMIAKSVLVETCENNCESGVCVGPECLSHSYKQCSNGDVYWYDSCNVIEEIFDNCGVNEECSNAECVESCIPGYVGAKSCSENNVIQNYQYEDCSTTSEIIQTCGIDTCEDGVCVSAACPLKPSWAIPGEWSICENDQMNRINYQCNIVTNFEWGQYTESQSCECSINEQCADDEICVDYNCELLDCEEGEIAQNHECVEEEGGITTKCIIIIIGLGLLILLIILLILKRKKEGKPTLPKIKSPSWKK